MKTSRATPRVGLLLSTMIAMVCSVTGSLSAGQQPPKKIRYVRNESHDLEDFRTFAQLATRLKPYGRVLIEISGLADKSWYEFPKEGSPWHEYCCNNSAPWKIFPHPDIAPHIPKEWVAANRKLLLAKADVARKLGLEPYVYCKSNHFLPESFFQQYPRLRGPRIDQPRRATREEFVWCTDLSETQERIRWMIAELKRNVPDLAAIVSGTNDSGAGLCWADKQYPGPNGPRHCRHISTAQRMRKLCQTIHQGAIDGGGDVIVRYANANLSPRELKEIIPALPPKTYINAKDPSLIKTGTLFNDTYPFRGMVDPLGVISDMSYYSRKDKGKESVLLWVADAYSSSEKI